MKVRGTSDFAIATTMDRVEAQASMQRALDLFSADHPAILEAVVSLGGESNELRVQIVLRSDSFAAAEDLMLHVAPLLSAAVSENTRTPAVTHGATELVPA